MYRDHASRFAPHARTAYFMQFFENRGVKWEVMSNEHTFCDELVMQYTEAFVDQEGEDAYYTAKHKITYSSNISDLDLFEKLQQAWVDLEYKAKQAIKNYLEEGFFE